jgi:hypothetical protein
VRKQHGQLGIHTETRQASSILYSRKSKVRKQHGQLGIHTEKLKGENRMKGPKVPARFGRQEERMTSRKAAMRSGQTNRRASHSQHFQARVFNRVHADWGRSRPILFPQRSPLSVQTQGSRSPISLLRAVNQHTQAPQ